MRDDNNILDALLVVEVYNENQLTLICRQFEHLYKTQIHLVSHEAEMKMNQTL